MRKTLVLMSLLAIVAGPLAAQTWDVTNGVIGDGR